MSQSLVDQEISRVLELLILEKEEDLRQYKEKMADTSLVERRREGVCWYPVTIQNTKYDVSERLIIKVLRSSEHSDSHSFSSGQSVSLFSNSGQNNETETSLKGIVNSVKADEMHITLNSEKLPDWLNQGKIGVQLLFDETSYLEMERACNILLNTQDENILNLKNVLLGTKQAAFSSENTKIIIAGLNLSQNNAINLANQAIDIAIIHGPPGTGKTSTLVEAIINTLKTENQVLVCAPGNAAVDLLTEKLSKYGVNPLRIGHPARVSQENLDAVLDNKISVHPNYIELKSLKKQADKTLKEAKKFKRNFGTAERTERKALYDDLKQLRIDINYLENFIIQDIISKSCVITSTPVGAAQKVLHNIKFNTVFIDEAAQATEPICWIPIIKAKRVIFAGDHHQLPPTIKNISAAKNGLSVTLFEKAIQRNKADIMLTEQYRMNSVIMNFSNQYFYDNKLIANSEVENHKIFDDDTALEFIDTAGTGYGESIEHETKSTFNKEEAQLLIMHLEKYLNLILLNRKDNDFERIAIISPYKAQVNLLKQIITHSNIETKFQERIDINTVDSFQGRERDIIYISLVRSNNDGKIGFLDDIRRMNVAMTRARKKLVIFGDSSTISRHPFYASFLEYVDKEKAYRSAFEFEY